MRSICRSGCARRTHQSGRSVGPSPTYSLLEMAPSGPGPTQRAVRISPSRTATLQRRRTSTPCGRPARDRCLLPEERQGCHPVDGARDSGRGDRPEAGVNRNRRSVRRSATYVAAPSLGRLHEEIVKNPRQPHASCPKPVVDHGNVPLEVSLRDFAVLRDVVGVRYG